MMRQRIDGGSLGGRWSPIPVTALFLALALSGCVAGIGLKYRVDPELYREPQRDAITFWGHACCYIDIGGYGIVLDPVFEPVYATFHKRFVPSPPRSAYDQTDVVLISHPHHDHLSPRTLSRFPGTAKILCPTRSAKYMDELPQQIITMRPGDTYDFPGGTITAVTSLHAGYRYSHKSRTDGRALGYIIRTRGHTLYYTGDTEYFEGIEAIGRTYRPDLAILNVSTHLGTDAAVRAIHGLGVTRVVPVHFGAYCGSNERRTPEYRAQLAELLGSMWVPLAVGESCSLDGIPLRAESP